jgi:acyl carrier protein
MKTRNEFLELLINEVLTECENAVYENSNFKELDCWDSITALTLIALFDSEFNYKLSGDTIKNCTTVLDLYELINK